MEEKKNQLRKIEEFQPPSFFNDLPEKDKAELKKKVMNNFVDVHKDFMDKKNKSDSAERDLSMGIEHVQAMSSEKKYYSFDQTAETGSGKIAVKIKGGDTKFIIPILVGIGIIIIAVLLFIK